jgi:lipid-A-disaccharide synthase
VIVYKVSPLSYWLGKRLIKVNYIGITNLIVQKELQPELIQDHASPSGIAQKIVSMIHDRDGLRQVETELLRVRDLLGGAGASERVARIALSLC